MFKNLWTYLKFGNHFCGIEQTEIEGKEHLTSSLLKKEKGEIETEAFFEANSIESLAKQLPSKQHVYLVVNNKNVLTKQIEGTQGQNVKLVHKAFPNIKLDDFFYQIVTQNNTHFISVCRKKYIEKCIAKYENNNLPVLDFALGNTIMTSVIKYIEQEAIATSNAVLYTKNKVLASIEKTTNTNTESYNLQGLEVTSWQILSFSAAFVSFFKNFNPQSNSETIAGEHLNNYLQKRFFRQFLKIAVFTLLFLLLINFLVFNYYYTQTNTLKEVSQVNQTTKNKVKILRQEVSKKKKMVKDLLKKSSSRSSFYTNAIVQSLPQTIILSDLNFQPLIKRVREGKPVQITKNIILVSGLSHNSKSFSNWIAVIENFSWVKNIGVTNYADKAKCCAEFTIKLKLNNEPRK